MNSLEFIDKLIQYDKAQLAKYPLSGKLLDPNYKYKEADIVYKCNQYYTEQLQILEQIKSELEAWYVVKEELQITSKSKNPYGEPLRRYELNVIGQNKIDTLNKALEVQDNDS